MKMLRPMLSCLLALLVLVSGTSFMVGVHHCNGHIQDVSLFGKADPCPMERQLPLCHKKVNTCCDDNTVVHEAQDFKASASGIHCAHAPLIAALASSIVISELIPVTVSKAPSGVDYSPPPFAPDLNIALSTFRI